MPFEPLQEPGSVAHGGSAAHAAAKASTKPGEFRFRKLESDNSFREQELELRRQELKLKQEEQASSGWRSPLVVAILAAAIAAIGNGVVTVVNSHLQRELESQRSEQTRILEMIKTGDPDKAAANLRFLLEAGLIDDRTFSERLRTYLDKRPHGSGPALPTVAGLLEGDSIHNVSGHPVRISINIAESRDRKEAEKVAAAFTSHGYKVSEIDIKRLGEATHETTVRFFQYDRDTLTWGRDLVALMKDVGFTVRTEFDNEYVGQASGPAPGTFEVWIGTNPSYTPPPPKP